MLPAHPLLNATAPAGPHLPVALLRQYAAGTLAPAARHRVEAHTLACDRCADMLEGLLQTPPATTDQALARLQQRLRQRVQPPAPARLARRPRRHRWLGPQLATAAALLLGLLAGGWWAWQQRQRPAVPVASVALPSRTETPTPPAPANARAVASQPSPTPTPTPIGGYAALHEYLQKGAAAFNPNPQNGPRRMGRVVVRLRIGADGQVQRAETVRKLRADYDAEAMRLLRKGPTWQSDLNASPTVDVTVVF
ncbi:zf-HC2 domain-containing protein [Hymenobacter psoromatis]|uniref:zf-HC2 domain-containing protein n=1 Tax=Hymenobacter psoromatis TaxID=1484116 RepID=UPI001CBB4AA3|nr:zf-HC2 domain-containing protein [Hymenobacter psoromatis]